MKFNNPPPPLLTLLGCLSVIQVGLVVARVSFPDFRLHDKNSTLPTNKTQPPTNTTQPSKSNATQVACGKLPLGSPTSLAPEGWQFFGTVVGEKESHYCGATVISSKQVITSRTCGYSISSYTGGKALRVVLGDSRRSSDSFEGQVVWANNDCSSKNYSIRPTINGLYQSMNDFLMIPLEEELTFNNNTQPICLPASDALQANQTSKLRCLQVGHRHSEPLEVESFEVQYSKCWLEDDSHFCFIRKTNPTYSTCENDSGSPIICYKDNKWHMIGLVTTIYESCNSYQQRFNVAAKMSYLQRLDSFNKCAAMK